MKKPLWWHLPAVIDETGRVLETAVSQTMVSACGRRGGIAPRTLPVDTYEQLQLVLEHGDNNLCEQCLVVWDGALEAGRVLERWVSDFSPRWYGPDARLFVEPPKHLCRTCGEKTRGFIPISVVPRRPR